MKSKYYAIFGVVFLLLSLGGAIYLSFQNADNRNLAKVTRCEDYGSPKLRQECAANNGGDMKALINKGDETVSCGNGAIFCGGCGGFCISGATKTCDQAILAKCGEYPTRGSTITGIGDCTPSSAGVKCSCGAANTQVCFSNQNVDAPDKGCNRTDGNSLCDVWKNFGQPKTQADLNNNSSTTSSALYFCPNRFLGQDGSNCTSAPPAGFNKSCYCGTIQMDTGNGFKSESMSCGCDEKPKDDKKPTPTRIPTATRTPTPTFVITTDTPTPTPTGTLSPTPTPTNTPTPTATPVPVVYGCGYTPCDNGGNSCSSGLVCITANNSAQYCSLPQFTSTCATNPGYAGCCTPPVVPTIPLIANGPSPTRIILPTAGFNFPSQALTIVGGIATLLGFLILL